MIENKEWLCVCVRPLGGTGSWSAVSVSCELGSRWGQRSHVERVVESLSWGEEKEELRSVSVSTHPLSFPMKLPEDPERGMNQESG